MASRPRNGFALLITLWLLVPVALLFLILAGSARTNGEIAFNLRTAAVLGAAADGGIDTATAALLAHRGEAPPTRVIIGDTRVTLDVEPLSGLLNPNLAPQELLRSLLARIGADPSRADLLATALVEWRTPGQMRRAGSSKAAEYRAEGRDYGPPGSPFETISELGDVLGMTPQILANLRPYVSLFSDRLPDPATAPPLLRAALGDAGMGRRSAPAPQTVFRITAIATGQGDAKVTRRAVIRFVDGLRPWRVLAWDSVP